MVCTRVAKCAGIYGKVCLLYRVTRHVASTYGRSMTNGANYKRGKLHHSPWHCDIHTSNQLNIQKSLRALYSSTRDLVPYSHSRGSEKTTRHFILSYLFLFYSQDSLHHNMVCGINISQSIYMLSIWPQMVVQHNRKSNWLSPVRELKNVPLGGLYGETMEPEGRKPTINTMPHLLQHPDGIHENQRFWLEQCRYRVERYDTTRHWGWRQLCGISKFWKKWVRPKVQNDRVCSFIGWYKEIQMKWCRSTLESTEYILAATKSTSITCVSPYTHLWYITMNLEAMIEQGWICTCRLKLIEPNNAHWGYDEANLDISFETEFKWTERCRMEAQCELRCFSLVNIL